MSSRLTLRCAVVALAFAMTFLVSRTAVRATAPPSAPLDALPFVIDAWSGMTAPPLPADVTAGLAADRYLRRYYKHEQPARAGLIEMDISYYAQPRVGANMHSPLNCLPGNGWEVTRMRERMVDTPAGSFPVRELDVARGATRYVLTYWFQGRRRIVSSELEARYRLLTDAVMRRPADAGMVRLMMKAGDRPEVQRAALAAFAAALIPDIAEVLRESR
jgi:EpsI family protein